MCAFWYDAGSTVMVPVANPMVACCFGSLTPISKLFGFVVPSCCVNISNLNDC